MVSRGGEARCGPPREQTGRRGEAARPQTSDGGRALRPRRSIGAVGAARGDGAAGVSAVTVCSVLPRRWEAPRASQEPSERTRGDVELERS